MTPAETVAKKKIHSVGNKITKSALCSRFYERWRFTEYKPDVTCKRCLKRMKTK